MQAAKKRKTRKTELRTGSEDGEKDKLLHATPFVAALSEVVLPECGGVRCRVTEVQFVHFDPVEDENEGWLRA